MHFVNKNTSGKIICLEEEGPLSKKCLYPELLWSAFARIQTKYEKMRTRTTPNTDTFHAVTISKEIKERDLE